MNGNIVYCPHCGQAYSLPPEQNERNIRSTRCVPMSHNQFIARAAEEYRKAYEAIHPTTGPRR